MTLSKKFWIIACFVYFLFILSVMLAADLGMFVHASWAQHPYDKVAHFTFYGIASFLCHRATSKRMVKIFNYRIPLGPGIFTIFTAAEEMLQAILPHRTSSIEDFLSSFAGIVVFYLMGEIWDRKKS